MSETLPLFWFGDRTHYEMGLKNCPRRRYLSKHAGPTGYGLTRKGESVPLATGTYTHVAAAHLFMHLKSTGTLPPTPVVREAINRAVAEYRAQISDRGFAGLLQSQTSDEVVAEQTSLLTGMIWVLALKFLPWFHQHYTVLECEQEDLVVMACECGLHPRDAWQEHAARGCTGIANQIRADVLAEHRETRAIANFNLKTTGDTQDKFTESWETKPQLALETLGVPARYLGRHVEELWIVGLYKGYREKQYDELDRVTGVQQASPLCRGYCRPANPPLATEDWKASYRYVTPEGTRKQVTKDYKKTGVWHISEGNWATWLQSRDQVENNPTELWVRSLPDDVLEKQLFLVGPMRVQEGQLEMLMRQFPAEEARWRDNLWALYEAQQEHAWASPEVQATLDRLIPCSWNCRPFGASHECEFVHICFRQTGWEDPLGTGKYVPRVPHHSFELQQAIGRGLLPDTGLRAEEDE
jgi:hypothetical protein